MAKKKPNTDRKKYKNMPIEDRIRLVENLYIHFPRNEKVLKAIKECHSHAKVCKQSEGILIQGDTGAGKTTIVRLYMKDYPRKFTEEKTIVPVLYAQVPVPATCKNLVTSLLNAIGDPAAEKGTMISQTFRLRRYIEVCEVELIILDDFQHFQDRDSLKVLKTVSDWLKVLMDQTNVPIALAGLPYSNTILDAHGNEQLQRRFAVRVELGAFRYESSKERQDFRRFLNVIDEKLPLAEKSDLADPGTALCIYEATNGVVAHAMKLLRHATAIAVASNRERISLDILQRAYEERLAAYNPRKQNPFGDVALAA
ncbi:MAG: TniB family NTP-binding protein [Pyrinomonadaceae bacterium]